VGGAVLGVDLLFFFFVDIYQIFGLVSRLGWFVFLSLAVCCFCVHVRIVLFIIPHLCLLLPQSSEDNREPTHDTPYTHLSVRYNSNQE
jgi:hypothetical protein